MTAAGRRAATNVTRKREAREWDEQHGKLVDLSAFGRYILPPIQAVAFSRREPRESVAWASAGVPGTEY